jgi:hypothetical protein
MMTVSFLMSALFDSFLQKVVVYTNNIDNGGRHFLFFIFVFALFIIITRKLSQLCSILTSQQQQHHHQQHDPPSVTEHKYIKPQYRRIPAKQ